MPICRYTRGCKDGMFITCDCGCGDTVICEIDVEDGMYFFMTYYNPNWARDQVGAFGVFKEKVRKIWRIIRNKDHHYSDIRMTREEFVEFREYVNSIQVGDEKEGLA